MSGFPDSWTTSTIGELCERLVDGSHNPPKPSTAGAKMLSARNIAGRSINFEQVRTIADADFAVEHGRTNVAAGDVLLTIVGTIGRSAVVPAGLEPFTLQRSVAVLKPKVVDPRYLSYALESPVTQQRLVELASGTAQKGIYLKTLASVELPVAPRAEQQRIAEKLDAILARVDACRDRLDRVRPLLERFRQSVRTAAVSGRLLGDSTEWAFARADEVCAKVQSGGTPKSGFTSAGVPFLKVYNIVGQQVDFDYRPQFVTEAQHNGALSKSKVQPGDVLMNIVGPPLGKVAVVPPAHPLWNINQAITLFRPSDRISSEWLYLVLCEGSQVRDVMASTKGSVGQVNVSLSQCRAFELPVPPLDEQARIVKAANRLLGLADRLQRRLELAQTAAARLTPALLAKAFRGELVSQDSNDEPAATMLARLASSRPPQKSARRVKDTA